MTPVRDRIPPIIAYLRILQEPGVNRTFGFLLPKKCPNRHGGPQYWILLWIYGDGLK